MAQRLETEFHTVQTATQQLFLHICSVSLYSLTILQYFKQVLNSILFGKITITVVLITRVGPHKLRRLKK